jgi:hypothetical protein
MSTVRKTGKTVKNVNISYSYNGKPIDCVARMAQRAKMPVSSLRELLSGHGIDSASGSWSYQLANGATIAAVTDGEPVAVALVEAPTFTITRTAERVFITAMNGEHHGQFRSGAAARAHIVAAGGSPDVTVIDAR